MDGFSFVEIMTAVGIFLGGQKGFEVYRRRKFANGDMRRNSLSPSDKEFVKGCFDSLGMQLTNDRLQQTMEITEAVRTEGAATRIAVRDRN